MSNPWDDFKATDANADAAPWEEFAPGEAPWEEVSQAKPKEDFLGLQGKIDAGPAALQGAGEAVAGMMSGLPAQIAGGLWGLSTLASGQGLEKAAKNVDRAQESNFGFGAFKPVTKEGAEATDKISSAIETGVSKAGDLGYKIGGELGRTNAEIAAQGLMDLVEPGAVIGGARSALRRKGTKLPEPVEAPKSNAEAVIAQTKDEAANRDAMDNRVAAMRERAARAAKEAYERKQQTLIAAPEGVLRPEDVPFRDQAAQAMEADLNAKAAESAAQERPGLTSLEGPDGQMSLFDQGDLMGQKNQFMADGNPDWRIDENGMPVRVDKSMEAENLEAPLQRNLWGDELGPALDQGRSITQSIDDTPANGQWAQRRGMINRLGGRGQELQAGPDLNAAVMEAEGMKFPTIDESMFQPTNPLPTERAGAFEGLPPGSTPDVPPQTPPTAPTGPSSGGVEIRQTPEGFVAIKDGVEVGKLNVLGAEMGMNPETARRINEPASVDIVTVDPSVRGTGIGRQLYQAFNEAYGGNIRPSGKTTADAWKVWKRDFPEKVNQFATDEANRILKGADEQMVIGNITDPAVAQQVMDKVVVGRSSPSETAASKTVEVLPPAERPPVVDTIETPRSPATIAARQEQRRAAEHFPTKLPEFEAVRTKEEAKQLARDGGMKDNAPGFVGRNAGSGVNWAAAMTNNPLIKFANTVFGDARRAADKFSRDHITGKEGLSPLWSKMDGDQRMAVADALMAGDKHQMRVTDDMMTKLEFNDIQRRWVDHYYRANDAMFDRWNQVLHEQGLKAVNRREGHVPGIFKGAYKALVTDEKGVQAVIAVDSKYQLAAAKEYFAKNHPTYTIVDQGRKGLADYKNQNDIFSGMNDVIAMLAENDPRFAEVQAMVAEAIKHGNNSMFAFNKHELSKKGVQGNIGNKPWLDKKANVEEWYKAMVQYFEEGALHHELQKPLSDVRELSNDPELNMPKTMKYLDSYVKHISGQNANNPIANAANWAIDVGPKLLGFGPRASLSMAGQLKNRMSQLFMGWGNWMFTAAQLAQPMQTGLPFMELAAGRLGKPGAGAKSMAVGGIEFLRGTLEHMTGKDMNMPAHMKEAYQYALDRGMLTFSEMERAYEGSKSKVGRAVDRVAEANMKAGEVMTRTPMFLSFVDMLHSSGIPIERALPIAENMTQLSMIDYHQWERPQMYAKLGTVGQFAGGLTTFKHGYLGQQGVLGKELGRTGNPIPIAASVAAMVALAGITGMPFYDELDNLFGEITDKFTNKRRNIKEAVLADLPEWAKSGAISNASNIAIQSKFSSANMVPDTPTKALSPQLDAFGKIIMDAIDVARVGDDQAWANLMLDISPSTFKGAVENELFKNENGQLLNRNRQAVYDRTERDWQIRKWSGLRSQEEALTREEDYKARQSVEADDEAKKKISQKFGRSILNDKPDLEQLDKFQDRGGNPVTLLEQFKQRALEKNLSEKTRRDMGIKGTPAGLREYDYYNKPGER